MNHPLDKKNIVWFLKKAKQDFLSMEKEIQKIVRKGLWFSFLLTLFSTFLLSLYLSLHNPILFIIGFSLLKSSIFFHLAFIAFGIIFGKLKTQLL